MNLPETPNETLQPHLWLDKHGNALFRCALLRVSDRQTAEDIVQETLVSAWKSRETFEGKSSELTWLISILKRRVADYFRSHKRQKFQSWEDAGEDIARENSGDAKHSLLVPKIASSLFQSSLEGREFLEILKQCVMQLPLAMQEAFLRRYRQPEADTEALAEQLGITTSHLNVRLYRARLLLRDCLERRWNG